MSEKFTVDKIIIASIILLLLGLPLLGFSQYVMRIVILMGIYTILALGLNILVGYTGLVSLGHAGFFAIGAYGTAYLMIQHSVGFVVALIIGTLLSGFMGFVLGLPTIRLSGTYLSIVTLGFAMIVQVVIMNWDSVTNGTLGMSQIPKPNILGYDLNLANHGIYYLMLFLLGLVTLGCYTIIHSKIGRTLRAIKSDELATTMMGIHIDRYKILAFVLSASITGLAGGFYATLSSYIDHNSFGFDLSILILCMVILGGMGTIRGMYLGAALLIIFPEIARPLMSWRFVVYGFVLIIMMHFRPQGVLGWRSRRKYPIPSGIKKPYRIIEVEE